MHLTYYLAAFAVAVVAVAVPANSAADFAVTHANTLVSDDAYDGAADTVALIERGLVGNPETQVPDNVTGIERRAVDMHITPYAKIDKFLTPLAKHIIKWYGEKKEANACYDYYVKGEAGRESTPCGCPAVRPVQDC